MPKLKQLFQLRHKGRTLSVGLKSRGKRKVYLGAINGETCAVAPGKGEVLRLLIKMAQGYPKSYPRRMHVAQPGNSR
jgi:hypothetical protein